MSIEKIEDILPNHSFIADTIDLPSFLEGIATVLPLRRWNTSDGVMVITSIC